MSKIERSMLKWYSMSSVWMVMDLMMVGGYVGSSFVGNIISPSQTHIPIYIHKK